MSEIPKRPPFPKTFGITRNEAAEFTSQAIAHEHAVAKALWEVMAEVGAVYYLPQDAPRELDRLTDEARKVQELVKASGWTP